MRQEVLGAGLGAAGMHEAAAEVCPAVHLDQQIGEFDPGQALGHVLLEPLSTLGQLLATDRADREVVANQADEIVGRQPTIESIEQQLQLGLALLQTLSPVLCGTRKAAGLGPQRGPANTRDQVGLGVGAAPAVPQPDVAGSECCP
jgi:hypothetical protein